MATAIASRFMSVDPHMKNAYSPTVKFDIGHKSIKPRLSSAARRKDINEAVEVAIRSNPPKEWEIDVRSLTSSRKWLQNYGLKKGRLQLNQILPSIGFKLSEEFDETLKRPVSSRYGGGLFRHLMRGDGKTFNISCTKEKLVQLEKRLLQAIHLFRRRLEWLTTESRRVFGVIEERAVTIVLDIRNMSPQQFDQYRTALEGVLREQVSQLAKFNLIRASEDIQLYSPECAPVSHDTLENAIQWMWNLDRLAPVSDTSAAEAIVTALKDQHNEAIYLFTEGTSIDSGKEVLQEKIINAKRKVQVNVVSFNCDSSDTIKFLKEFVKINYGKFHAYAVVMELDAYDSQPADGVSKANILLRRKTFGGIPAGSGVREDVVLVFEEMEEARNNLAQVRMLIENTPDPKGTGKDTDLDLAGLVIETPPHVTSRDEQYMSSRQWLETYGLNAKKLGLYDVLASVAFKHMDGVVDIMHHRNSNSQTDAVVEQKLVNARYCDNFPIVRWRDGRVVHVQVTPEVHRNYEEHVMVALNKIQQRMDWLNQGSRALFGTLCEDQLYILIDTSASMQPSLGFVKQKLFVLMQEQLRHKKKFNIVTFNSKAVAWKDRLVDVSERSLQSAWSWVQNLSCWGSTNTYAAIQLAMSDPLTEAIYLLTDGRPDQPPRSIIAQVQMKKHIPIHTISFNCDDREANNFLFDLSEATVGRYHYFNDRGKPVDQPESWESVDLKLLKDEMCRGFENLDKLASLRDECTRLAWKKETDSLRQSIEAVRESKESVRKTAMPPMDPKDLYRPDLSPRPPSATPAPRPSSAGPSVSRSSQRGENTPDIEIALITGQPAPSQERPSSAEGTRMRGSGGLPNKLPRRPKSAKVAVSRPPMVAGHTRTSLLRTLNSSGRFSPNEWLLPETKSLFQLQVERQKDMAKRLEKKEQIKTKRTKKLLKASEMSSKQWLGKHGLVAKKLTILDALGSTFVMHKPKYVSILDKNVMSKVFDDIMPIAHVSKSQQIRLVNPNGVNLKEYENKVTSALDKYRQRLNTIVWNALPDSSKDKFDSSDPVSFMDNKEKLILMLQEADWPIKEQDVTLLIREITRAEKFLRQSQELRKAATGEYGDSGDDNDSDQGNKSDDDDDDGKDHDDDDDDENKKDDEEETLPYKSPPLSERSNRSNRSRSNKSGDASPPRSEAGSKASEGLGQVIRSVDKTSKGKVKESQDVIKNKIKVKLDTLRGQRVIARKDGDGLYYPAVVVKCSDPRHATVQYKDGPKADILTRNLIPTGGAVAQPKLYSGDYVLMRVVSLDTDTECYVPAIIQMGPMAEGASSKFYSVLMYNGQKASTVRTYLVKITKERFELASMYIADQQNENRSDVEDLVYVSSPRTRKKDKSSKKNRKSRSPTPDDPRPSSKASQRSREKTPDYTPIPSDVESEGKQRSRESTPPRSRGSSPRSRSPSPRPGSGDKEREEIDQVDRESIKSYTSRMSELERLRAELEKQKKKNKKLKKAKKHLKEQQEDRADVHLMIPTGSTTPRLFQLRKSLTKLKPGEEVLARWADDGWYYRGMIRQNMGDFSYIMEDSTGSQERIMRDDIISEDDNGDVVHQVGDSCIALHPVYSFSYAPGHITEVTQDRLQVKFYDEETAWLPLNEVYHTSEDKYDEVVQYIERRESELVGASVVAMFKDTGEYFPGSVKRQGDGKCQYVISWPEGSESDQDAIHIFSAFTRRRPLTVGDRVLAMVDPVRVLFLPGKIIGSEDGELIVEFCNGEKQQGVDPILCYWLSQHYYETAVNCYKKQPKYN